MPSKNEDSNDIIVDNGYKYPESNALISAKYGATLLENKILAIAFSELSKAKIAPDGRIIFSIRASQIRKLLRDDTSNIYASLNTVARNMTGRVFGITNEEKQEFHYAALVTNADYEGGVFTITFNSALRNYLVDIQGRYTLLSLSEMLSFKSVYSFRIYEILRSQAFERNHNAQRTLDGGYIITAGLSELKFELGLVDASEKKVKDILSESVPPDYDKALSLASTQKYKDWTSFRRTILDVAIKEINEKTGMTLSYEQERAGYGGKVIGVEFHVSEHDIEKLKKSDAILEPDADSDIIDAENASVPEISISMLEKVTDLIDEKISIHDAEALLKASGNDISKIEKAYDIAKSSDTEIRDLIPWLISAIKKGYEKPVKKSGSKKSAKANFTERGYTDEDMEKLMKKLLKNG